MMELVYIYGVLEQYDYFVERSCIFFLYRLFSAVSDFQSLRLIGDSLIKSL